MSHIVRCGLKFLYIIYILSIYIWLESVRESEEKKKTKTNDNSARTKQKKEGKRNGLNLKVQAELTQATL